MAARDPVSQQRRFNEDLQIEPPVRLDTSRRDLSVTWGSEAAPQFGCAAQSVIVSDCFGVSGGFTENSRVAPCWRRSGGFVATLQASSLVCGSHLQRCCSLFKCLCSFLICPSLLALRPSLTFSSSSLSSSLQAAVMAEYRSRNRGSVWFLLITAFFQQMRKLTQVQVYVF